MSFEHFDDASSNYYKKEDSKSRRIHATYATTSSAELERRKTLEENKQNQLEN